MILTDCSVLVAYQRGRDAKLNALVPTLQVVVCGATVSEALGGSRTPAEWAGTVAVHGRFQTIPTPEPIWLLHAEHLAALRRAGLAVPYPDVLVATVGIHHNIDVWARDHHFPMMQAVLPALRLFAEPP